MKLIGAAVLVAALLLIPIAVFAEGEQQAPVIPPTEVPAAENLDTNPFLQGAQNIGLAAGLHIPSFLTPVSGGGVKNIDLGSSFSFSYQYFIARGWAIGGSLSAAFNSTIGGSSLFTLPLGVTASYWWTKLPLEFTLGAEAGAYLMRENGKGMFGPFGKVGGGAYWRISPSWGIGIQTNLWLVPEIHYGDYASLSQFGGFVETSLSAVYHL
jgi:hypothetical protein